MNRQFSNVYDDKERADSYDKLEFPGTYYLAYRDIPAIISEHVKGTKALDFGCGTGRSTRFISQLGFNAVGVDISTSMLKKARERDPQGDYRLVDDGDLSILANETYDLIFSAFTFDNVPSTDKKVKLFKSLKDLLKTGGRLVSIVSSPDIYTHEWASFSTKDFPENRQAKNGDKVKIVMLDVDDRRPVEDILCTDDVYSEIYKQAGLKHIKAYRPLANPSEPYPWVSETKVAPWVIYVLE